MSFSENNDGIPSDDLQDLKIVGLLPNPNEKHTWDDDFIIPKDEPLNIQCEGSISNAVEKALSISQKLNNPSVGSFEFEKNDMPVETINQSDTHPEHDQDVEEDWDKEFDIDSKDRVTQKFLSDEIEVEDRVESIIKAIDRFFDEGTYSIIKLPKSSRLYSLKSEQLSEPAFAEWIKNLIIKYNTSLGIDSFYESSKESFAENSRPWSKFTKPWLDFFFKHFCDLINANLLEKAESSLKDFLSELSNLTNAELLHLPSKEIGTCIYQILFIFGKFINDEGDNNFKKMISNMRRVFSTQSQKTDFIRLCVLIHTDIANDGRPSLGRLNEMMRLNFALSGIKNRDRQKEVAEIFVESLLSIHMILVGRDPLTFDKYRKDMTISDSEPHIDVEVKHILKYEERIKILQEEYQNIPIGYLKSKIAFALALHNFQNFQEIGIAEELAFEACFISDLQDKNSFSFLGSLHDTFYNICVLYGHVLIDQGKILYACCVLKAAIENLALNHKFDQFSVFFLENTLKFHERAKSHSELIFCALKLADSYLSAGMYSTAEDMITTILDQLNNGDFNVSDSNLLGIKLRKKLMHIYLIGSEIDNVICIIHVIFTECQVTPSQAKSIFFILIDCLIKKRWIHDAMVFLEMANQSNIAGFPDFNFRHPILESIWQQFQIIYENSVGIKSFLTDTECYEIIELRVKSLILLRNYEQGLKETEAALLDSVHLPLESLENLHLLKGEIHYLRYLERGSIQKDTGEILESCSSFDKALLCIPTADNELKYAKTLILLSKAVLLLVDQKKENEGPINFGRMTFSSIAEAKNILQSWMDTSLKAFIEHGQVFEVLDALATFCEYFILELNIVSFWKIWNNLKDLLFTYFIRDGEMIFQSRYFWPWAYSIYPILERAIKMMDRLKFNKTQICDHIAIINSTLQCQLLMQDSEYSFSPSEWSNNSLKSSLSFYETPFSSMSLSGSMSSSKPSTMNYLSFSSSPTRKKHPTVSEIFQGTPNLITESLVLENNLQIPDPHDNHNEIIREIRSKSIMIEISRKEYYQGNLSSLQLQERSKASILVIKSECNKLRELIRSRCKAFSKFSQNTPSFTDLKTIDTDITDSIFILNLTNLIAVVIPEFGISEIMHKIPLKRNLKIGIKDKEECFILVTICGTVSTKDLKTYLCEYVKGSEKRMYHPWILIQEISRNFFDIFNSILENGNPTLNQKDRFHFEKVTGSNPKNIDMQLLLCPENGKNELQKEHGLLARDLEYSYLEHLILGGRDDTSFGYPNEHLVNSIKLETAGFACKIIDKILKTSVKASPESRGSLMVLLTSPSLQIIPWETFYPKLERSFSIFPPSCAKENLCYANSTYEYIIFKGPISQNDDFYKSSANRRPILAMNVLQRLWNDTYMLQANCRSQKFPMDSPLFRKEQKLTYYRKRYKQVLIYELDNKTQMESQIISSLSKCQEYPLIILTIADLVECSEFVVKLIQLKSKFGLLFISGSQLKRGIAKLIEISEELQKNEPKERQTPGYRKKLVRDMVDRLRTEIVCSFFP